jgi:Icc-related predicted phosphoesterase
MPFAIAKEHPRLWSLNSGVAMVVTDLHGDWKTYQHYRDCFMGVRAKGKADYLIFTGDLIHSESEKFLDQSIEIVLDVLSLRSNYGDAIIYLCGNHELPHIYGYCLAKGQTEYTPAFEHKMSQSRVRAEIIDLFMTLPFYIRTSAGISITHAGASPVNSNIKSAKSLFTWNHQAILAEARAKLSESDRPGMRRAYAKLSQAESYEELAVKYLSTMGTDDPRYDDLLLGFFVTSNNEFDLLYSALSTACEQEFDAEVYDVALTNLLQYLSLEYPTQSILVSGHMTVQNGYQVVTKNQLRIASGVHAKPLNAGRYLLFDTSQPIENMENLLERLFTIS